MKSKTSDKWLFLVYTEKLSSKTETPQHGAKPGQEDSPAPASGKTLLGFQTDSQKWLRFERNTAMQLEQLTNAVSQ